MTIRRWLPVGIIARIFWEENPSISKAAARRTARFMLETMSENKPLPRGLTMGEFMKEFIKTGKEPV